jgi:hypothetical protein
MNNFNVSVVSTAIVLGGIIFGLLVWQSVAIGAQHYAERFAVCVNAGGTWIPTRGDNDAACVRP